MADGSRELALPMSPWRDGRVEWLNLTLGRPRRRPQRPLALRHMRRTVARHCVHPCRDLLQHRSAIPESAVAGRMMPCCTRQQTFYPSGLTDSLARTNEAEAAA